MWKTSPPQYTSATGREASAVNFWMRTVVLPLSLSNRGTIFRPLDFSKSLKMGAATSSSTEQ